MTGAAELRLVLGNPDDPRVGELLYQAIGGDRQRLITALAHYRDNATLMAATDIAELLGVIGFRVYHDSLTVLHIATADHRRRAGVGRFMLGELRSRWPDRGLVAETDAESVGFYSAVGFEVSTLGEKYPGVERFRVRLPPRA
ncbi:GNAT family N-acetyltransferase [Nocardia blacklockiae]|uniref:GNAT family N-acetyltransferase n=1 Tax=Nocardia blacklockiae TaxID=480036 RepID=UPI001892E2C7|nr:GNAT family N-acetyltransferase [Nocardia blacklockiae]MBF6176345.1 GNAT family N-acetyltransferase [Nocardia blacklockiae]